jgi:hypothetical protein
VLVRMKPVMLPSVTLAQLPFSSIKVTCAPFDSLLRVSAEVLGSSRITYPSRRT